eukprot:2807090-Pyramimonas_sp.AAC.1
MPVGPPGCADAGNGAVRWHPSEPPGHQKLRGVAVQERGHARPQLREHARGPGRLERAGRSSCQDGPAVRADAGRRDGDGERERRRPKLRGCR